MILWRVLPWWPDARSRDPGGPLWFPRELQGAGRHDNPDRYGCLYVGELPVSPVAEALAPFRGAGVLTEGMLRRTGAPLALAQLSFPDDSRVIDLDDPGVLVDVGLSPSQVATGVRVVTQAYAARLFGRRPAPDGLRWSSTIEASLANLTIFDRAQSSLELIDTAPLTLADSVVHEAAELVGLAV